VHDRCEDEAPARGRAAGEHPDRHRDRQEQGPAQLGQPPVRRAHPVDGGEPAVLALTEPHDELGDPRDDQPEERDRDVGEEAGPPRGAGRPVSPPVLTAMARSRGQHSWVSPQFAARTPLTAASPPCLRWPSPTTSWVIPATTSPRNGTGM